MKRRILHLLPLLAASFFVATSFAQPGKGRSEQWPNGPYEDFERYPGSNAPRYDRMPGHQRVPPHVVRRVPNTPRMHPGRAPSPAHTWVSQEFIWRNGRYRHVPGYWTIPPRRGMRYVPGYWQTVRGGYVWMPGAWSNARGRSANWY